MISPMAIGILVVPTDILLMDVEKLGNAYPRAIPKPIAVKIHRVKLRSRKLSFFMGAIFANILRIWFCDI